MKKEKEFAQRMSQLLFEMRIESDAPYGDNEDPVSQEFAEKIIDDPVHMAQIKKRIYASVLDAVTRNPLDFENEDGEFTYTSDTYDHAMAVDAYVDEMYDDTLTKIVYICMHCNSDNVQVKAWVRPNEGMKYVDEVNEGDEPGWCDDCDQSAIIQTAELKKRAKVVGFQVMGEDGTNQEGEIHPHMDASFCLYSLDQARSMMDDDNNGEEQWNLRAIWTGDVEEPTMMFEGDPRG